MRVLYRGSGDSGKLPVAKVSLLGYVSAFNLEQVRDSTRTFSPCTLYTDCEAFCWEVFSVHFFKNVLGVLRGFLR